MRVSIIGMYGVQHKNFLILSNDSLKPLTPYMPPGINHRIQLLRRSYNTACDFIAHAQHEPNIHDGIILRQSRATIACLNNGGHLTHISPS
jgi:hypothetical protein